MDELILGRVLGFLCADVLDGNSYGLSNFLTAKTRRSRGYKLIVDHADDEINVLLPTFLAVIILFCLSILSLALSYVLRNHLVFFNVSPFKIIAMKWFGLVGGGITVLIMLGFLALDWGQRQ